MRRRRRWPREDGGAPRARAGASRGDLWRGGGHCRARVMEMGVGGGGGAEVGR